MRSPYRPGERTATVGLCWPHLLVFIFTPLLVPTMAASADIEDVTVIEADSSILDSGTPFTLAGQSLRFTPVEAGYAVQTGPAHFEMQRGDLSPALRAEPAAIDLPFPFPFFGKPYEKVYAYAHGIVSFERLQRVEPRPPRGALGGQPPMIAALWSPCLLSPPQSGLANGVYINTAASDRVLITWYRVGPALAEPVLNTFQLILSKDGSITISFQ